MADHIYNLDKGKTLTIDQYHYLDSRSKEKKLLEEDQDFEIKWNNDGKYRRKKLLKKREPTHILGYPIGAICVGKDTSRYAGIIAVIELWDYRTYEGWTKVRKVPLRYLEHQNQGIPQNNNRYNGINKALFIKNWEIIPGINEYDVKMMEGPEQFNDLLKLSPDSRLYEDRRQEPPEPESDIIEI